MPSLCLDLACPLLSALAPRWWQYALVGLGMNGHEYLGTFDSSLSFNQVCLVFASVAACMVTISFFCIEEQRLVEKTSFREYAAATWQLMRSSAFFYIVLWHADRTQPSVFLPG